MEDVLAVYMRPHDPDRVLVCLDETSKQLIAETRVPIPMKAGRPARVDYEYERNGTANLFMLFAPLEGWRHVEVTDRHTAIDYAHVLKDLADIHFPYKKSIVLVQDNLNVHSKAHSTKLSRLPKLGGWSSGSNGITRPSTAVGLIWRNPSLVSSPPNASTAASRISRPSPTRSPPGSMSAMPVTPNPTGALPPTMPALSSKSFTLQSD